MRPTVKLYGQKRTGTNLMQYLLQQTGKVKVWVNEYGWKHGPPKAVGDYQIIMCKTFADWKASQDRYTTPAGEITWTSYEEWHKRDTAYEIFCRLHTTALMVRYDELIEDPEAVWRTVTEHLCIKSPFPGFPDCAMGRNGSPTPTKYVPGELVQGVHY